MKIIFKSRPIELIPSGIDEKFLEALKQIFKVKFKTNCKEFGNRVVKSLQSLPIDLKSRVIEEKEKFYLLKFLYPIVFRRYKSLKLTNKLKKWRIKMEINNRETIATIILHDDYPHSAPWKITSDTFIDGKRFEIEWRDLDPDKCLGHVPKVLGLSSDKWNYTLGIVHFLALVEIQIRTRWESREFVLNIGV